VRGSGGKQLPELAPAERGNANHRAHWVQRARRRNKTPAVPLANRGKVLVAKANHGAAIERAEALRSVFAELADLSARAAAAELDRRGIATPSGAKWSAMAVLRVRERLARG
jgi:hypothetical protein